ncbi:uncharacterized protein BP5553_02601 [Venustampulla echinocandica]|uniref:Zn(2)-C6 fungal-type domain-containing protein n=1 Tax=Venustampulla echinocandica TaxID=2656787 RepID=A0A370TRX3_9HELO|nr:uncharacterized protein BP5553_02601 [Venustampulla echinocandica]RDL38261.1 hypothetical protein BP5553_02601 [Venustampulla echinocandica]
MKPASRKPHRKTRTGCRTCKQRKIKCDEKRPSCTNCLKHSVACDFFLSPANLSPGSSVASPANSLPQYVSTPSGSVGTPASHAPGLPLPSFSRNLNLPSVRHEPVGLNMIDLELLHNFSVSTCLTLHNDPALKTLWKVNVPQLGISNDFVMRGILAVSALHMAHFLPEKREFYLSQAFNQHQSGLRTATSILPNVTEENCSALYVFSALTLFFSLAGPRDSDQLLGSAGDTGISDWLSLLQGAHSILTTALDALVKGPLGPMFEAGRRRDAMRENYALAFPPEQDPLQELRHFLNSSGVDERTFHTCHAAIEELRKSFAAIYKQGSQDREPSDIFIWLFRVHGEFLGLVRGHSQEALAIFGHFCVLLKLMDYRWWMEGSALQLLSKVYELLDEDHRLWIRWPIEEVGWVPSQEKHKVPAHNGAPFPYQGQ